MAGDYQPIPFGKKKAEPAPAPIEETPPPASEEDYHGFGPRPAQDAMQHADLNPETHKVWRDPNKLPKNIEAEAALLGAMMIDNRLVDQCRERVRPEHFFDPLHQWIYETIIMLCDQGKVANPVTLKPMADANGDMLKSVGGPGYLAMLTGSGAALIGARDFADQVAELAKRRDILRVIDEADVILNQRYDPDALDVAVGKIDSALMEATAEGSKSRQTSLGAAVRETVEAAQGNRPKNGILVAGFADWNAIVGRMPGGMVLYLGGRPSMGKTALAAKVAKAAASWVDEGADELNQAVEFWSLETTSDVIGRRMLADEMFDPGVTSGYEALVAGDKLTMADWRAIAAAQERLDALPLGLDDPDVLYVENLAADIRRKQRKWERKGKRLALGVIDYLGLMQTIKGFSNGEQRLSYISRMVKAAAKQTGVPLIVLCQLSRAVEQRENKRPMLVDLRESGSLEQDADVVVFVYRDQYYLERSEPPKDQEQKHAEWAAQMLAARDRFEIYSAKKKEGALVKREAYFIADHQAVRPSSFKMPGASYDLFAED